MSQRRAPDVGSEVRRGAIGTALGIVLGLAVALFAKRGRTTATPTGSRSKGSRWRGRSAT